MLAFGVILGISIHSFAQCKEVKEVTNGPRCNKLAMKLMKVKVLIEVLIGLVEQRRSFFLHFFVCFVPRFSPPSSKMHTNKKHTNSHLWTIAHSSFLVHVCHLQTPFTLQTQIQPQATLRLDVFGGNDDGTGAKTPISASFPLTNYSRRSTCAVPRPGIIMAEDGGTLGVGTFWAMKGWFFNAINIETVKYLKFVCRCGEFLFFSKQSEPPELI